MKTFRRLTRKLHLEWIEFLGSLDPGNQRVLWWVLWNYLVLMGWGTRNSDNGTTGPLVPHLWRALSSALPYSVRERVFEPAYNDLLNDYCKTWENRQPYQSTRLMKLYYTWKVVLSVAGCWRVWIVGRIAGWLGGLAQVFFRRQ